MLIGHDYQEAIKDMNEPNQWNNDCRQSYQELSFQVENTSIVCVNRDDQLINNECSTEADKILQRG